MSTTNRAKCKILVTKCSLPSGQRRNALIYLASRSGPPEAEAQDTSEDYESPWRWEKLQL